MSYDKLHDHRFLFNAITLNCNSSYVWTNTINNTIIILCKYNCCNHIEQWFHTQTKWLQIGYSVFLFSYKTLSAINKVLMKPFCHTIKILYVQYITVVVTWNHGIMKCNGFIRRPSDWKLDTQYSLQHIVSYQQGFNEICVICWYKVVIIGIITCNDNDYYSLLHNDIFNRLTVI